MSETQTWAEQLTKKIYLDYKDKYSYWSNGLKVFYSPVTDHPDLTIISYQPGGSVEHFEKEDKFPFERGDFRLPTSNAYIATKYPMAWKVRELFGFKGGLKILQKSVVFPLIFFRAPDIRTWKNLPRNQRLDMEEYCFAKIKEIIQKLKPKKILVLGIATYKYLKKNILPPISREERLLIRARTGHRLAISAKCFDYEVLAIIHPSGARISLDYRNKLKKIIEHKLL